MNARPLQWLAVLWIAVNLYVWGLVSGAPPFAMVPRLHRLLTHHQAILFGALSRPYVWSKEGK
jgi:hypothetical protein